MLGLLWLVQSVSLYCLGPVQLLEQGQPLFKHGSECDVTYHLLLPIIGGQNALSPALCTVGAFETFG